MNCYNSAEFLTEAIDSVYAQTYDDWEIVFWDNQSTDDSPQIAQRYDERLLYFRGAEFVPLGEARNQALNQARGEFVAILDCDDIWRPDKLEKQIRLFESDPNLGVVYSNCDIVDRNGRVMGPILSQSQYYRGKVFESLLLFEFFPPWPTVVMRKKACEPFKPYKVLEDYDLLLRIAYRFPFGCVSDSLALYRTHAGQLFRDFELTLEEQLSVCDFWSREGDQSAAGLRLIRRSRARSYLSAATAALYRGNDPRGVRQYLRLSLKEAISGRAVFYLVISFIWQRQARKFLGGLREKLGYGPNLHTTPD
jgi:glycosyltransferase involved in cell wall biosynthesis